MSTGRACFLTAALCCVALCGSAQGLFTPDMGFDDNSFPRCISALSDSAMVWEEQRIYGQEAPSRLEVENCESLSVSRTSFYHDEGEVDALRWTSTWVDWLEQMRDAGVEDAQAVLDSWRQQGQPYVFDYCLEMDGGHCLHAEPGQFVIEFYAVW